MPREKGLKNRDLNDAYLAYRFSVSDGAYTVYIDATTGEVLSADSERSLRAKAFSIADDPAFPYPNKQTSSAKSCFDKLGYVSYASFISSGLDLAGSIRTFIKQDDSYGFYLACHGDQTVLTNNRNWWIYPSEINGNWRFVFLDACYSAAGTAWSDRFHITNSSINRAFLGWSNTVNGYDSTAFTNIFFPEVTNKYHASNIRDAAVWAASQIPGAGTTPIRFYGDRTYDGRV